MILRLKNRLLMQLIKYIYKAGVCLRNWLYDENIFSSYKSSIPIISVGNITVGGTGKTPFVIYLVELCKQKGLTPAILTRGYKRESSRQILLRNNNHPLEIVGDEPFLLSSFCPDVDIVINKNRVAATKWIEKTKKNYDIIILDDAFQHRAIARDLNILLMSPEQNMEDCPPVGHLREPFKNINRADCVVFTKGQPNDNLINQINLLKIPQFQCDESFRLSNANFNKGISFCGIGNPDFFIKTLNKLSIESVAHLSFKDHEKYNDFIIKKIEQFLLENKQTTFFTTKKDWIKLPKSFIEKYNGVCVDMFLSIEGSHFTKLLENTINVAKSNP